MNLTGEEEKLIEIFRKNRQGVMHGTINLAVKVYENTASTIDASKFVYHKTVKGNVEGVATVVSLMKNTSISIKQTLPAIPPSLTFTVFYNRQGEIERIGVNDFNRHNNK